MSDNKTSQELVDGLVSLLTVEQNDENSFTGQPQKDGVGRVFGGQVIAQALMAAQRSVPDDKIAHSLHAYFLRGGKEGPEIDYRIERDFDGRSFANRRVVASQAEEDGNLRPILNLTASFQTAEDGLEHQDCAMPDVAPPEDLKSDMELRRKYVDAQPNIPEAARKLMLRPRPIEMRTIDRLHWMNSEPKEPCAHTWFKTAAPLPDDPALHRAVIAYASDYTLLGTAALPHGLSWMRGELTGASLDHAVWFHRPARADDWLLYATDSPWSGSGRGFNRGRIFNRAGELVASVAQEGMMRRRRSKDQDKA
ncbi:acyl-CoA thioesterase II [Altererythrobacter luteolus]|uniref:Acyl-CoA thioesterase 2 n=1 Tax=Pontixanthobacter luteolus TaxID=295089 RepID=A0A6I4V005_9SPHN|nr:acyl-CoA thioesterase II [Pontixanthobacter luteolus]MXP47055.1 acyl-CoA thioesterase II [Pontixanthobacter luteolus]